MTSFTGYWLMTPVDPQRGLTPRSEDVGIDAGAALAGAAAVHIVEP